ncbi:Calcium channel [Lachnellula occidentalis]|uniref:Calcium channel n=1 Tax=Lachnellula occidentalis TaxID=215460 RepID=A0A8H8S820_9HELO|nr:Calcium channel [Lachnellula occidentalis]
MSTSGPSSPIGDNREQLASPLPKIKSNDSFVEVVKSLSVYFVDAITLPSTFEELSTTTAGNELRTLADHLVASVHNPALVNSLLISKWHFSTREKDDRKLNDTRAHACEMVAWELLTRMSERDAVDFCLYELPALSRQEDESRESTVPSALNPNERSSLLPQFRAQGLSTPTRPGSRRSELLQSVSHMKISGLMDDEDEEDPMTSFTGLNGLEIAAVADCKRFLSQRIVQKIVTGIWNGDITFWDGLNEKTLKKPQFYSKSQPDPFTRLRVPRYIKAFEIAFFATFLVIYYAVAVEKNLYKITYLEVLLYFWFAAFTYDEVSEFIDAGSIFYAVDVWNGCDIIIILIGAAFLICRVVGLVRNDDQIIHTAFRILSLEALIIIPRTCSILSVYPYFGTLIPCLKKLVKDFVKFMVGIAAIIFIAFLTTFTLLAEGSFTRTEMSWVLVKVFLGSSYLGFDIMSDIDPTLGPPLMLIFVCMTNILLITTLISILSGSFSELFAHARDEYLFVYSVYVLEASTSNRLTHFYPPLNLIPLILIRPFRLCLPASHLRRTRIILLKITHAPFVACIWLFERVHVRINKSGADAFSSTDPKLTSTKSKKQDPFLPKAQNIDNILTVFDGAASPGENYERGKKEGRESSARERALEDKVADLNAQFEEFQALSAKSAQIEELKAQNEELKALIMAGQGKANKEGV